MKGIFVTGTGTGVGKTFVTAGIAASLMKRGYKVGIMKPVASGATEEHGRLVSEDVAFYKQIFNFNDDYDLINPYCFKAPVAPGVAARQEGVIVSFDIIKEKYYKLSGQYDILLVEGAGGLQSPVNEKFETNADLAKKLDVPVIIVSQTTLGTINQSILTIGYAEKVKKLHVLGIIFNCINNERNDITEKTNPEVIKEMSGVKIIGHIPYYNFNNTISVESLQSFFINKIDLTIK
ncbi:MAG: dethiobiotin synthase [Candidatus Anammoxibacter sp.]